MEMPTMYVPVPMAPAQFMDPRRRAPAPAAPPATMVRPDLVKQGNQARYKTELCRAFQDKGTCKYGEKCQVREPCRSSELLWLRSFLGSGTIIALSR